MQTRRDFLRKGLYAAPLIHTIAIRPSFARSGYGTPQGGGNGGGPSYDLGGDGIKAPVNSNPGGGSNLGGSRSGGHKNPHDWWMFWQKL